jgi:phospholipase C
MSAIDKIEHVVVLMLENHSFDQMLGCMSAVYDGQEGRDRLDGIDLDNLRSNDDPDGPPIFQAETTERQMTLDPHHEVAHVATQLENNNGGFVRDFVEAFSDTPPSREERQNIMGYYPVDFLPGLHQLARNFTVCDHWFSSLPGPTWPNRFFALSGTALGHVDMPNDGTHKADLPGYFQQTQDTIFDRLNEKQVTWKVYFHDLPQSWVMKQQRAPHNAAQYYYVRRFYEDARGHPDDFPQFALIEPDYFGYTQNDDHPPHDIMRAQKLIADVYNALRANDALWKSTLLVVFYDEHGGFYDHVEPPAADPPDGRVATVPYKDGMRPFKFDRLGLRVPAILASPWVKAGVEHTQFDHTSLLRLVTDKWELRALDSARVTNANSIEVALNQEVARTSALPRIVLSAEQLKPLDPVLDDQAVDKETDHQKGLKKLAEYLPTALWEEVKETAFEEAPRIWSFMARCMQYVHDRRAAFWDWLRGRCEYRLAALYETGRHEVVLSSPDKIDQKLTSHRNRAVRFLSVQKSRAMEGLSDRVLDPKGRRSPAEREHAARACRDAGAPCPPPPARSCENLDAAPGAQELRQSIGAGRVLHIVFARGARDTCSPAKRISCHERPSGHAWFPRPPRR